MEWAFFISKIEDLKYWNKKYSRIYFGNEFCERLMPSVDVLEKVLVFVKKNNLEFSLVTGFVTDKGLKHNKVLVDSLSRLKANSEVVINDWGLLGIVKEYKLKPVLGRLLVKQKRDPRILDLKNKISEDIMDQLREPSLNVYFLRFLDEENVKRIELDNLLHNVKLGTNNPINQAISLYFPYGYVATTRLCSLSASGRKEKCLPEIMSCNKECQIKKEFAMNCPMTSIPLLFKGNTVFFENYKMSENIKELGIDRIIYQPTIPI